LFFYLFGYFLDKASPGAARRRRKSESRRRFVDSVSSRPSPRGFGSSN